MRASVIKARMRNLPVAPLDRIAPGTSLILAPHPDDESLGCGGLIAALCAQRRPPVIVCVTDGSASHPGSRADLASIRRRELHAAAARLGVPRHRVHMLGLPDARAPESGPRFERAANLVVGLVRAHAITTIFASWAHDPHCDHHAAAALARRARERTGARLRFYPVWGWLIPDTADIPVAVVAGARLRIAGHLAAKCRAIAAHASQYGGLITDDPHGFRLPHDLLAACGRDTEVFLTP